MRLPLQVRNVAAAGIVARRLSISLAASPVVLESGCSRPISDSYDND